jgi:hypothetical protein
MKYGVLLLKIVSYLQLHALVARGLEQTFMEESFVSIRVLNLICIARK